ncbi:hypothetical protein [Brevibacterium luteolum]|nr:hypothetical protein [Brevibacterium luteolum]
MAAAAWALVMLTTRSLPVAAFQSTTTGMLLVVAALAVGSIY